MHFNEIKDNGIWLLGNGPNINFWFGNWSGQRLSDALSIPEHIQPHLKSKVSDYITNNECDIPLALKNYYPNILNIFESTIIPMEQKEDELCWSKSDF